MQRLKIFVGGRRAKICRVFALMQVIMHLALVGNSFIEMGGTADILKSIGGTAVIKIYLGGIPDICRYYYYYLLH